MADFVDNFEIPFDYFMPIFVLGIGASAAGFGQSVLSDASLGMFSPEQLVGFQLPVQTAVFLAVFLQAVAGWGFALAAITGVALLGPGLTVKDAQAYVALIAVVVDAGMFLPYMKTKFLERRVVDRWVVGAILGTPLGVIALKYVDEKQALFCLGLTTVSYCLYSAYDILRCYHGEELLKRQEGSLDSAGGNGMISKECALPPKKYPSLWTWLSGAFAGVLGGAFDAPGPPLVVFSDLTGMSNVPDLLKANILAFFAFDSQLVAVSDLLDNRFSEPFIWPSALLAIPTAAVAYFLGRQASQRIDQEKFRWIVLGLLGGSGLHQMGIL